MSNYNKWLYQGDFVTEISADIDIWYSGILIYKKSEGTYSTPLEIARAVLDRKLDFNKLSGFFRLVIYEKKTGSFYFFGDTCGSQLLYYNKEKLLFSNSLLYLSRKTQTNEPNNLAIAQIINLGCIITDETIMTGIYKTSPDKYYILNNGHISSQSKGLVRFSDYHFNISLGDIVCDLLRFSKNKPICAVSTGGTDSRAIIAHIVKNGTIPELVLTAHEDNPDLPIAQKIAKELNTRITVIDPSEKSKTWIKEAFEFSDASYDVVLCYRHLQKALWAKGKNINFEFGGVGGEFYKNNFLFKNPMLVKDTSPFWSGDKLIKAQQTLNAHISAQVKIDKERGTLCRYNRLGWQILCNKSGQITNSYSKYCIKLDPLMTRNLVAKTSQRNPLLLSMNIWQRKEINKSYSKLAEIETDTGYSCTIHRGKLFLEALKKSFFWCSRIYSHLKRSLGLKYKKFSPAYWNKDYYEARQSTEFVNAMQTCKKIGILSPNISESEIPLDQVGNILLFGMAFENRF